MLALFTAVSFAASNSQAMAHDCNDEDRGRGYYNQGSYDRNDDRRNDGERGWERDHSDRRHEDRGHDDRNHSHHGFRGFLDRVLR